MNIPISHRLTCLFETGRDSADPAFNAYAKVENDGDARGYTCGWAGFTTADEEVVMCVEEYTRRVGHNHLWPMLAHLRELRDDGSANVQELDFLHFKTYWQDAATNGSVCAAYEEVVHKKFGLPAQSWCSQLKLKTPGAYAVLFDTCTQHGDDGDPDSCGAIALRAQKRTNGAELGFLQVFLDERQQVLEDPHNKASKDEWAASTSRVVALDNIVLHNIWLTFPLQVVSDDFNGVLL